MFGLSQQQLRRACQVEERTYGNACALHASLLNRPAVSPSCQAVSDRSRDPWSSPCKKRKYCSRLTTAATTAPAVEAPSRPQKDLDQHMREGASETLLVKQQVRQEQLLSEGVCALRELYHLLEARQIM